MPTRIVTPSERPSIVVSASSFIKEKSLCHLLEQTLPRARIVYVSPDTLHTPHEWTHCLQGADAWLVGREAVSASLLQTLPRLKVIAKYGVGLDNVDQAACAQLGIAIAWEAGVNREAVAEHTLGLMLALTRNIGSGSRLLAQGQWLKNGGQNLSGQKVGIIGLGHIGRRVAELLQAFRCEVRFCDILAMPAACQDLGIEQVTYPELLGWADMLSFHVPLTELTRGMLDEAALLRTRSGVRIINTSRGQVINQNDLKTYLAKGHLAGAALDVYEEEPLRDKELYSLANFLGTAHTAGNSREAVWAMGEASVKGLQKVLG